MSVVVSFGLNVLYND